MDGPQRRCKRSILFLNWSSGPSSFDWFDHSFHVVDYRQFHSKMVLRTVYFSGPFVLSLSDRSDWNLTEKSGNSYFLDELSDKCPSSFSYLYHSMELWRTVHFKPERLDLDQKFVSRSENELWKQLFGCPPNPAVKLKINVMSPVRILFLYQMDFLSLS